MSRSLMCQRLSTRHRSNQVAVKLLVLSSLEVPRSSISAVTFGRLSPSGDISSTVSRVRLFRVIHIFIRVDCCRRSLPCTWITKVRPLDLSCVPLKGPHVLASLTSTARKCTVTEPQKPFTRIMPSAPRFCPPAPLRVIEVWSSWRWPNCIQSFMRHHVCICSSVEEPRRTQSSRASASSTTPLSSSSCASWADELRHTARNFVTCQAHWRLVESLVFSSGLDQKTSSNDVSFDQVNWNTSLKHVVPVLVPSPSRCLAQAHAPWRVLSSRRTLAVSVPLMCCQQCEQNFRCSHIRCIRGSHFCGCQSPGRLHCALHLNFQSACVR